MLSGVIMAGKKKVSLKLIYLFIVYYWKYLPVKKQGEDIFSSVVFFSLHWFISLWEENTHAP